MTIHLSHDLHRAHQRSVLPNHSSDTSINFLLFVLRRRLETTQNIEIVAYWKGSQKESRTICLLG